jgi:GNAT superfamily N-acetyltransferase
MTLIQPVDLLAVNFAPLRAEAREEGYNFIETLVDEWTAGKNRYDGPGEVLCGSIHDGELICVGGLNRDPFLDIPSVGRIRRVYVRPAWRNRKLGTAMVSWLLDHARNHFDCVRLRAENASAARLYERLGFTAIADPNATHIFHFQPQSS